MIVKRIIEDINKYVERINKKNNNDNWQIRYEDKPVVVIIGEDHRFADIIDSEEWKLQCFIITRIKPEYIISERDVDRTKQQIKHIKQQMNKIEDIDDVCLCGRIGSDEERQGEQIEDYLSISERPVIAFIGHAHAGADSKIHEYIKNNNIHYICIWNKKEVKNKDDRDARNKEEEENRRRFGIL